MAPIPRKQNPQRQPLTTSLRKICRDYPAGAGILNELLQNADDAGASTVRFVLDTRSHPDKPVLVDGLFEFQGPALLIYNDAPFSEQDFRSLTSLGDSSKLQNRTATGKFGLGFCSVFNWTDCPSIISGSTLLCLDPHDSWSSVFDPPGGPIYDFPKDSADECMINQLQCFSLLNNDWSHPFDGTIIRIPLRTTSQAEKSKISSKPAHIDEILCAMDSFAEQMGSEGLLFLKSVHRIILEVDHERRDEVNIVNTKDLMGPKNHLGEVLHDLVYDQNRVNHENYYEVSLRHWTREYVTVNLYGVLNLVVASMKDRKLEVWAASEKLFPWVAVAALLKQSGEGNKSGRLFCTLPLPISTGLPLNIHGLFSISSDRSRLHGSEPGSVHDHRPEHWNRFLFKDMIPNAWAKLLCNVARGHPSENHFRLWPTNTSSAQELWYGICSAVVTKISRNSLQVWFTEFGYVSLRDGLLASDQISLERKRMFSEAKLAVIFLAKDLYVEACLLMDSRILQPKTLCERLQHTKSIEGMSRDSRLILLEFLLPEMSLSDIAALEIFPFLDGNFRSLDMTAVFLNRNDFENKLFMRQKENTIDDQQLTETAAQIFHQQVKQDDCMVRYRTTQDLQDYCFQYVNNGMNNNIVLDDEGTKTLNNIWKWIFMYCEDKLDLTALGSLWLVPLQGGGLRKLVSVDDSDFVTWFRPGPTRDVALKIVALHSRNPANMLAENVLENEILRRLLDLAEQIPSLCIKDGERFLHYLDFLAQGLNLLWTAPEDTTASVLKTLRQSYLAESPKIPNSACQKFRSLCLFTAVRWSTDTASHLAKRQKIDLMEDCEFIGLKKLVPISSSYRLIFLDATEEGVRQLFEKVGLVRCLDEREILQELVIPALQTGGYDMLSPELRLEAVNVLFANYHQLSTTARSQLSGLKIVPIQKKNEEFDLKFGIPQDMLDPSKFELACLYFENETRHPDEKFCNRFRDILAICGMIQSLSERVILDRIEVYQKGEHGVNEVVTRAKNLLQMQLRAPYSESLTDIVRQHKWLPVKTIDGNHPFSKAAECRDIRDELIIGHIWPVVPFLVDDSWRLVLGWHDSIGIDILMAQLVGSIAASNVPSVEATLVYLHQNHPMESYASRLLPLNFVRNIAGNLVSTAIVCRGGAEKLAPYLHMVESRFWDKHNDLMKLADIPLLPSKEHLLHILSTLRTKKTLSEEDLDVAIEVANIWSVRFSESVDGLVLATTAGVLLDISDLSYNDVPWNSVEDHVTAHPKISRTVAESLKIRFLSDVLRYGVLGISDLDDGEFNQREEVADGIRDTLDRYARGSTFHEYVANADDCSSASEINFLVDRRTYDSKVVLTEELKAVQGPSLLIHNNGVFTDADFEGFKHVGRGSKRDDPTTIGKFGRGSQTMYHWTDVPMILSGSSLLILDPLRKYLPYNYRTRQKMPGIKIEYAKLKSTCPDQIVPFEGLWGFDSSQSYYKGTIFRFPLRQEGEDSELVESLHHISLPSVIQTFRDSLDIARSALLFLRNVTAINFSVNRDGPSDWSVRRGHWPDIVTYSDWANVVVEVDNHLSKRTCITERWWRVIVDVSEAPAHLQYRHKRRMKHVECGIAALIPVDEKTTTLSLQPLKMRFFNYLPLKFQSTLPVQIHATFLLTGDRQSIATEETSQDAGSEWNRWLLETQLPIVYLQFLEDMGRKIGEDVYKYFPVQISDKPHLLSDLIRISFWEKVGSSSCRLFPITHTSDAKGFSRKSLRIAPKLITFEESVFDLLDETKFDTLRLLINRFRQDLVRVPFPLQQHIKDIRNVKILTPSIVRNILKSAIPADIEEAMQNDNGFLKTLLYFIMPNSPEEIIDFHNCPVLPLLDGRIGVLLLKPAYDENMSENMYFSASTEHQKLFSFASSIFCARQDNSRFVKAIVESGLMNVKRLERNDANVMLTFRDPSDLQFWSATWLYRFWNYTNTEADNTESEPFKLDTIRSFSLVLMRHSSNTEEVKSLTDFDTECVVMKSTNNAHMNLFADFPGLLIADSKTLPVQYQDTEKSLFDPCAIKRFSRSLSNLAKADGKSLTEYVRANLKKKNIKTMQELFVRNLSKSSTPLPKAMNQLPLWPSVSADQGYLTTNEVMVANMHALVVPWIKDYHRFTIFNEPFLQTPIDNVTMLKEYVLPSLPQSLDEQTKPPYIRMITAIANSSNPKQRINKKNKNLRLVVPLNTWRLAAGRDGVLHHARDLFDHTDAIFLAAFRNQYEDRFLMPDIQNHMVFWRDLGLRSGGQGYNPEDYLTCLGVLEERLARGRDQHVASDARVVVNPMCINDGKLVFLNKPTWSAIAGLQIFIVRQDFESEPEHRRQRMGSLSSSKPTLCLQDIVRYDFAAVCWSQVPFPLQEPTTHSFQKCGYDGKPTCRIVWRHLAFLAELAPSVQESDIDGFVDDLQKTYDFLNLNLRDSENTFTETTAVIWWNTEALESSNMSIASIKSSWTALENLLLDTPCDAPPLAAVQPFLGRFSTLLKALGCPSIHYPQINASSNDRSDPGLTFIRELWQEGALTDVIFGAEGKEIAAHKVVLASRSTYCKTQFNGLWASASSSNTKTPIELEGMSYRTLQILIDFCYGANVDWAAIWRLKEGDELSTIADKLDGLLDVLVAADRWVMPDLCADAQSHVLAGIRFFVRPDNVTEVRTIADEANATELRAYCDEYAVYNAEAILLASADTR